MKRGQKGMTHTDIVTSVEEGYDALWCAVIRMACLDFLRLKDIKPEKRTKNQFKELLEVQHFLSSDKTWGLIGVEWDDISELYTALEERTKGGILCLY